MSDDLDPRAIARIVVRPLGSPLPLGFFAFGTALGLMSALELGLVPATEAHLLALALLAFAAPLEALAGVLAYLSRDTVGGTLMGLFSTSWVVTGLVLLHLGVGQHSATLGMFYALLACVVFLLAAVSIPSKPFFAWLLFIAAARFALTSVHQFGVDGAVVAIGAAVGILLMLVAYYGAVALLLEDAKQRTVLPLFRRRGAKRSIEGSLSEQLKRLSNEPGVRTQL